MSLEVRACDELPLVTLCKKYLPAASLKVADNCRGVESAVVGVVTVTEPTLVATSVLSAVAVQKYILPAVPIVAGVAELTVHTIAISSPFAIAPAFAA